MSTQVTPERPWLGLRYFTEEERGYFFGRTAELGDLFERVLHKPLTILFGQSGLGKTSLLRAGLIPQLRAEGFTPLLIRLDHGRDDPPYEQQVLAKLKALLLATAEGGSEPAVAAATLWEFFHDPACGFLDGDGGPRAKPVLIFDQFEEIFTIGQARNDDAQAFRTALSGLVENRIPDEVRRAMDEDDELAERLLVSVRPCKVLLALREDFLHQLERWRRAMPSLMENRMELRLLTGPQALDAVVQPGRLRCAPPECHDFPIVSEETGAAIVRFVAGAASDVPLAEIDAVPPLLSLLCAELNDQRLALPGTPSQVAADQLGGSAEQILERFYQACFVGRPRGLRELVEDRLLSPDGYRQSVTTGTIISALAERGTTREQADSALAELVDARLLTVEERGGARRVELTHDILTGIARRSRDARADHERRRKRVRLAAVVLLLLVAGLSVPIMIWALWERKDALQQRARAEEKEMDAMQARQAQRDLLQEAARSDRLAAQEKLDFGEVAEALAHHARAARYVPDTPDSAMAAWPLLLGSGLEHSIMELEGHTDSVVSAEFSPDGRRILTASKDGSARMWETETGKELARLVGHTGSIRSAEFSPDGRRVLTLSENESVRLWDAVTGKEVARFVGHTNGINSVGFSPDGRRVLTASADNTARMWDSEAGKEVARFKGHTNSVMSAEFSPDGRRVVTASEDGSAQVWDAETGKELAQLVGNGDRVNIAEFSPDGRWVLTASEYRSARVWDAETGEELTELVKHGGRVNIAKFSPDGRRVLTASEDGSARVSDAKTGEELVRLQGHASGVTSAEFSSDGRRVLTASEDESARVWDAEMGDELARLVGHKGDVTHAEFSPDGRRVLTASEDKSARVWEADAGGELVRLVGHEGDVIHAEFSPNGWRVLTVSEDETVRVWNAEAGTEIARLVGHSGGVMSAGFSPDGRRVLTASGDGSVRVWDAEVGREIARLVEHSGGVESAEFSADGRRVLTASGDGSVRVWDAETGKELARLVEHSGGVESTEFSADGRRVLTASGDGSVRVWDAETGKELARLVEHSGGVESTEFSPDGRQVLTASRDGSVRVWDADTGREIARLVGHNDSVWSAEFSPDGRRALTASWDGSARIWDAKTGREIARLVGHSGGVESAEFSPDGRRVLTVFEDESIGVWDAETGKALAQLVGHGGRGNVAGFSPDGRRVLTASGDGSVGVWDADTGKVLTQWVGHGFRGNVAGFSPDGRRVLTASIDNTVRLSPLPPDTVPPPWFPDFLTWLAGAHLRDDDGLFAWLASSELREIEQRLRTHVADDSDYARLLRWRLTPPRERLVDPYGTATRAQLAAEIITRGETMQAVEYVYSLDPWHPLIHLHLASFENDPVSAEFLRRYSLDHLPVDAELWGKAAAILVSQEVYALARRAAEKAIQLGPDSALGHRALAQSLDAMGEPSAALAEWEKVLAAPEAGSNDFSSAGHLAARLGRGDTARGIFTQAEKKFSDIPLIFGMKGWALINLHASAEALEAFRRWESMIEPEQDQSARENYGFAGLAAAQWLNQQRDSAVETYRKVIESAPVWGDAAKLPEGRFPEAELKVLEAVRAETIKRYPDLVKP